MNTETLATAATKVITRIAHLRAEGADIIDAVQVAAQETLDSMILNGAPATAETADKALTFVTTVFHAAAELAA